MGAPLRRKKRASRGAPIHMSTETGQGLDIIGTQQPAHLPIVSARDNKDVGKPHERLSSRLTPTDPG
jgi:hypothetical protein